MLQDLDELILKCRDERARAYIREAVVCCKAGAYRSAIVSTWIAVAFDIVDKIHELSLAGDKEAEQFIVRFESAMNNTNYEQSLAIERDLLALARKKFELVSNQEYTDLDRLRLDRHRCAHPSRLDFNEVFNPPAELARLHIRSAVEYLLQHEPSQGKAALAGLVSLVNSDRFPRAANRARQVFDGSALRRARPALIRNFVVVMLKTALSAEVEYTHIVRCKLALVCVSAMHPLIWEETMAREATRLFRGLTTDTAIARGIELLASDVEIAAKLEGDQIVKLEQFVLNPPDEYIYICETALEIPLLNSTATKAISSLSAAQIDKQSFILVSDEVRERIVHGYSTSISFENANTWGKLVREFSTAFTAQQVTAILTAASTNPEIKGSFQLPAVLRSLWKTEVLEKAELDRLIGLVKPEKREDPGFDEDIPF